MVLPESDSRECQVLECGDRWMVLLPNKLSPTVAEAAFGDSKPGDLLKVCRPHYRFLKRVDGVTLGWRTVKGKLTPYIKDESF
jgi:hypothetical protein